MTRLLSEPPNLLNGHRPDKTIYRSVEKARTEFVKVTTQFTGYIPHNEYFFDTEYFETNVYDIAVTIKGNRGPIISYLHGVPTNRFEWIDIQNNTAPFCQTYAFDMLGMGDSSKPRYYGYKEMHFMTPETWKNPWDWVNDVDYVNQLMNKLSEKFIFVASDWGAGIALHYAIKHSDKLHALILLDPIIFDGYPVSEIQAFGRASILDDDQFMGAMGAADQTMVQILKTMTYDPNVWNQYKLRDIKRTYIDVDYERSSQLNGEDADSLTLKLKYQNLRVLADRAAVLSPAQLLPIEENRRGVDYNKITVPVLIIWGAQDNMMPSNQAYRLMHVLKNSPNVQIQIVENAGHFVELDQPDRVSEIILNFIQGTLKLQLADPFLGFTGIWKGDEDVLIEKLRKNKKNGL